MLKAARPWYPTVWAPYIRCQIAGVDHCVLYDAQSCSITEVMLVGSSSSSGSHLLMEKEKVCASRKGGGGGEGVHVCMCTLYTFMCCVFLCV